MKKTKSLTLLLALTFLFSGSVYGQETEVKKEFYDSGELKSEIHYKDGKRERMTGYYESGAKKNEAHFKNGKEEGLETRWYINGRKNQGSRLIFLALLLKK